jgi:hypothetical protein
LVLAVLRTTGIPDIRAEAAEALERAHRESTG